MIWIRNIKFILSLIYFICLFLNVSGQNFQEDMKAISQIFRKHDRISIKMEIAYFYDSADQVPAKKYKGLIQKEGNSNYYGSLFGQVQIFNEEYSILIDHNQKVLKVTEIEGRAETGANSGYPLENIDSMMKFIQGIKYYDLSNDYAAYYFEPDHIQYKSIWYEYNVSSHKPKKIIFFLRHGLDETQPPSNTPMVVFEYHDVSFGRVFEKDLFATSNYLIQKGEVLKPASKFKDYRIIY